MAVEDKYRIVGPTDAPDTEIEEAKTAKLCQQQHSPEYFFSFYGSFGSATASANRVSEAISYIRKHKIRQSDPRYSRITTDRLWYVITDPCFDLSSYVEKAYHSVTGITVRYEYTCYNIEMGTPNNGLYGEVLKFRTIEEFDKRTESRIKYDVDNIEYTNGK